jgi:hypothetical protein
MAEAKTIIKSFCTIVKKKDNQVESLNNKILINLKTINNLEEKADIKETYYNEEGKLRKYYQSLILKMVRELNLFNNDEEKLKLLDSIYEHEDDLIYQRHIYFLLNEIGLK